MMERTSNMSCSTTRGALAELENLIDYNAKRTREGLLLIRDIKMNRKHHTIHCLSVSATFVNLTGLTMAQFSKLFAATLSTLKHTWPNCPVACPEGMNPGFGTLRFKLFLSLYRLRRYEPYTAMEVAASCIHYAPFVYTVDASFPYVGNFWLGA